MSSGLLTCITCSVAFKEASDQRDHYKTGNSFLDQYLITKFIKYISFYNKTQIGIGTI